MTFPGGGDGLNSDEGGERKEETKKCVETSRGMWEHKRDEQTPLIKGDSGKGRGWGKIFWSEGGALDNLRSLSSRRTVLEEEWEDPGPWRSVLCRRISEGERGQSGHQLLKELGESKVEGTGGNLGKRGRKKRLALLKG